METTKEPSRTLKDIVGAPFPFKLKDGTVLGLDDWTVMSEMWANKTFGSFDKLLQLMFRVSAKRDIQHEESQESVNAIITVAAHQLDDSSYRIVEQKLKEGQTTEEFLASNLKYNDFAELCIQIMVMIKASLPEGWEEEAKKKVSPATVVKEKRSTRR